MKSNRREFLAAASCAGCALALDYLPSAEARSNPAVPDPNDPNDPNAITDPDHEIGKPYVGWKEGELDLHFISTGCGENMFYLLPDGTTVLNDTGDWDVEHYKDLVPRVPDASRRGGEWVARYISRLRPELKKIDYVLASHFHNDHTGCGRVGVGMKGLEGRKDYQISGISHVGEYYQFGKAFDRGYPTYDRPTTWAPEERENLINFWEYAQEAYGLEREEFKVGALDQIKLVNEPEKYDFHVRNICRNGVLWGGEGGEDVDYFAKNEKNKENRNENTRSIAFVMQFGAFRFYTGGDTSGNLLDENGAAVRYEDLVGKRVGHVDVCKANHHSYLDSTTKGFVNALSPRVFITCVWDRWHLQDNTASNMCDDSDAGYPGPRLMCPTSVHPGNAEMMQGKEWRKRLVERGGHVVVKVVDGGARYKVYYLTHHDESMKVELVFGPFESNGAVNRG